jgi:predicted N-acetyltransferase YhbS
MPLRVNRAGKEGFVEADLQGHRPILRDLGDGLVLRRATPRDIEPLTALLTQVFEEERVGVDVRAIIDGLWPVGSLDHFTLVEDTNSGAIVSSLTLFSKTCAYDGIPFGVGQPEFVATHPDYRRRGLIRAQMETVHAWSEARGDLMQIIAGIPNYYRQFGYEYALDLDIGRVGFKPYVPQLKEGEAESHRLRPATPQDAPFIAETHAAAQRRYAVSGVFNEAYWRGQAMRSQSDDPYRLALHVVESQDGEPVGYVLHQPWLRSEHQVLIHQYELKPGIPWLPVSLSVLRDLCARGEAYAAKANKTFGTFNFFLGPDHPIYEALHDLLPRHLGPYGLYVRIPNLVGFMQHIAPALENRLAASILVNYTGELKISFYRDGLRLVFERGRIQGVELWQPTQWADDIAFPDLTFLQVLLGYRSLEEVQNAFTGCRHRNDAARALAHALFPKQTSYIFPN